MFLCSLCRPVGSPVFCMSTDCSGQDEKFSLVFTIASFMNNFLTLPSGFLFDHFGTTVARLVGMWVWPHFNYWIVKGPWIYKIPCVISSYNPASRVVKRNAVTNAKILRGCVIIERRVWGSASTFSLQVSLRMNWREVWRFIWEVWLYFI